MTIDRCGSRTADEVLYKPKDYARLQIAFEMIGPAADGVFKVTVDAGELKKHFPDVLPEKMKVVAERIAMQYMKTLKNVLEATSKTTKTLQSKGMLPQAIHETRLPPERRIDSVDYEGSLNKGEMQIIGNPPLSPVEHKQKIAHIFEKAHQATMQILGDEIAIDPKWLEPQKKSNETGRDGGNKSAASRGRQ